MRNATKLLILAGALTPAEAIAQNLLVCRHNPARIEAYSATDGSLVDPLVVDINGLLGLGGATSNVWDVTRAPNGELWVSNFSTQSVQRFSSDGTAYLGNLPTTAGSSTGLGLDGNVLAIAASSGPGGVYTYDIGTMTQTQVLTTGGRWDVTPLGNQWLVANTAGTVSSVDRTTGVESTWANPGGFCEQIVIRPNGEVLVANFSNQGYTVHDSSGGLLQTQNSIGAGSIRGIAPLANGNVLVSGTGGVSIYAPSTGTSTNLSTGSGAFIYSDGGGGTGNIGTNYCTATPNSTGTPGSISAFGSNVVSANDVTLVASGMPPGQFGIFVTSLTQDFVPNVGSGNLCVGGLIGRYQAPGQILQIDANGEFSIPIDTALVPQGAGLVPILPGQTRNFQAWHRDFTTLPPIVNTSNFTDAIAIDFQ